MTRIVAQPVSEVPAELRSLGVFTRPPHGAYFRRLACPDCLEMGRSATCACANGRIELPACRTCGGVDRQRGEEWAVPAADLCHCARPDFATCGQCGAPRAM